MGTTAQKITYLGETKSLLKDTINMSNANITNSTTFRNYAQALYNGYINVLKNRNTLLDNMNIGTSTGSITDSANLPIYEDKMSKLSTQDGTPSPNNPVEVKTVKGYRNLFDINTPTGYYPQTSLNYEIQNNSIVLEAIGTTGAQSVTYTFNDFDDTKNYTLSFKAKKLVAGTGTYAKIQITILGSNDGTNFTTIKSVGESTPVVNQEYSLNWTVSGYKYYKFLIYNDASTPVQLGEKTQYYDILFTEGDNILPYVPYGNNYIYTRVNGKNISPVNSKTITGTTNASGQVGSINGTVIVKDIPITNNTTYYISGTFPSQLTNVPVVFLYNGTLSATTHNGTYTEIVSGGRGIQASENTTEITNTGNYQYMAITTGTRATYSASTSVTMEISNLMVSIVPNETYEAYKEKIITIPLNDNEICGIGDYKDELVIDKYGHAKLNKKIGKVVLDGNENWGDYPSSPTGCYRAFTEEVKIGLTSSLSYDTFLSDYFGAKAYAEMNSINITKYATYLNIDNTIANNTTELKNWLSTHNTTLYYVLATEQEIDLGNIDMELYEGTNNITNSEDMDMSIKYIKDTYE